MTVMHLLLIKPTSHQETMSLLTVTTKEHSKIKKKKKKRAKYFMHI